MLSKSYILTVSVDIFDIFQKRSLTKNEIEMLECVWEHFPHIQKIRSRKNPNSDPSLLSARPGYILPHDRGNARQSLGLHATTRGMYVCLSTTEPIKNQPGNGHP